MLHKTATGALYSSLLLAAAGSPASTIGTDCDIDPDRLGARYEVARVVDGAEPHVHHVQVWRHGNQVAYIHEEKQVTEIWDLVSDGRQKLIRYFDAFERAIEYQPAEISSGSGSDDWSRRYELVGTNERAAMTEVGTTGGGCGEVTALRQTDERTGASIDVDWRPSARLVERIEKAQGIETTTWTLVELHTDGQDVDREFTRRRSYQTVDFVDIGDHESDPFIRKMIQLGYVNLDH